VVVVVEVDVVELGDEVVVEGSVTVVATPVVAAVSAGGVAVPAPPHPARSSAAAARVRLWVTV
jgi:hypothetical protein